MVDEKRTDVEQSSPKDVIERADEVEQKEDAPVAPPFAVPSGTPDEAERPVVNPVTGGAL